MTHFDDIYDIAADGYGIVTAAQAQEASGCADGRLVRRGRGAYKLARWVPTPYTTSTPRPWHSWARAATRGASVFDNLSRLRGHFLMNIKPAASSAC